MAVPGGSFYPGPHAGDPQQRTVIQIATTVSSSDVYVITALCNDGSIWELVPEAATPAWTRLLDIPQG
ncbi:MAG: hypothetical protein J2P48_08340 [Alphaproteobacteria bacterium]|nr:hypothetical protein [Alphaproteobacteria bacterium]